LVVSDSNVGNPSYEQVPFADGSSYWRPRDRGRFGVIANTGSTISYAERPDKLAVVVSSSVPATEDTTLTSIEAFEIATLVSRSERASWASWAS
jgi:hypothetical protein